MIYCIDCKKDLPDRSMVRVNRYFILCDNCFDEMQRKMLDTFLYHIRSKKNVINH